MMELLQAFLALWEVASWLVWSAAGLIGVVLLCGAVIVIGLIRGLKRGPDPDWVD